LHFNLADFPVNFIKPFSVSFGASNKCYQNSSRMIVYII